MSSDENKSETTSAVKEPSNESINETKKENLPLLNTEARLPFPLWQLVSLFLILILFTFGACLLYGLFMSHRRNSYIEGESIKKANDLMFEFQTEARNNGLKIFLIEPNILRDLLTDDEVETLLHQQLLPRERKQQLNGKPLTSLAILNDDINEKKLCDFTFKVSKFNCTEMKGEDGSRRTYAQPRQPETTLHYLFENSDQLIHVTVLHSRKNMYWIGSLLDSKDGAKYKDQIYFGRTEMAFDKFSLTNAKYQDNDILIPDQLMHFVSQLDTSRFLECNLQEAKKFHEQYDEIFPPNESKTRNATNALKSLKAMMKNSTMEFWMASGTLLGWYRQCDFIPYTSDIDFGTWSRYASKESTEKFKKNQFDLKLRFIYGYPDHGYELTFFNKGLRVDLFYVYKEDNVYTVTGHIPKMGAYLKFKYPKFTGICSAELFGLKVLVPCNAREQIEAEFGPDWTKPVKQWSYIQSPHNKGEIEYWKDTRAMPTYYTELD